MQSDRPLLNERAVQHIGQCFELIDPIVNGRGSIKIGDSIWRVEGPELPKGAVCSVLGADGTLLESGARGSGRMRLSFDLDDVDDLERDFGGRVVGGPKCLARAIRPEPDDFDVGEAGFASLSATISLLARLSNKPSEIPARYHLPLLNGE